MADLIEFLHARLDEDAALAELQQPWSWRLNAEGDEVWAADDELIAAAFALSTNQQRNTARWIVRFDPARVLRDVEAKRKILDRYDLANGTREIHADAWLLLRDCVYAMAAIWADHPDFDPTWTVTE